MRNAFSAGRRGDRRLGAAAAGLSLVGRAALGTVFLATGVAKIADPVGFLFSVRQFRLLPGPLEAWAALLVPWLELLIGLLLLCGLLHRAAALLCAALNLLFAGAIWSVIARGIEIDCGCFGLLADKLGLPDTADVKSVVRNLVFAGASLFLATRERTPLSLGKSRGAA